MGKGNVQMDDKGIEFVIFFLLQDTLLATM